MEMKIITSQYTRARGGKKGSFSCSMKNSRKRWDAAARTFTVEEKKRTEVRPLFELSSREKKQAWTSGGGFQAGFTCSERSTGSLLGKRGTHETRVHA